jgi:hypothetical protein
MNAILRREGFKSIRDLLDNAILRRDPFKSIRDLLDHYKRFQGLHDGSNSVQGSGWLRPQRKP